MAKEKMAVYFHPETIKKIGIKRTTVPRKQNLLRKL